MEVKEALTGDRSATKEQVQEAVVRHYPAVLELRRGIPKGQWEHPHDALAAGHFLLGTDAVRRARQDGLKPEGQRIAPAKERGERASDSPFPRGSACSYSCRPRRRRPSW